MPVTFRCDLNNCVPWPAVAKMLGITLNTEAVPVRVTCPLCHKPRLGVYQDTRHGGYWHNCSECGSTGDMIELAAAVWRVAPETAMHTLKDSGLTKLTAADIDDGLGQYLQGYSLGRRRALEAWQMAKINMFRAASADIVKLRHRFRVNDRLSPERWKSGPGELFGHLPAATVRECTKPTEIRVGGFRWPYMRRDGDLLVFPFWDVPGRLAGFYAAGGEGTATDCTFCNIRAERPDRPYEAGLFGLPFVLAQKFRKMSRKGYVFTLPDVGLAARLHMRSFHFSMLPLPLVAWYDDGISQTNFAWQALRHRPLIHWGLDMSPALLWQAMQTDSLLAILGPFDSSQFALDHYVRLDTDPIDTLKRVERYASPWRDALRAWSHERTPAVIEELLHGMRRYNVPLRDLADYLPLRSKPFLQLSRQPRGIDYTGGRIYETVRGWYRLPKPNVGRVMLTNFVLRIDTITNEPDNIVYRGRVICNDIEAPFRVDADVIEKQTATWLQRFMIEKKIALPEIAPGWERKLLDVANRFQNPRIL